MNIFFDLDGTILDSRERLFRLFQHLTGHKEFSFDEYWDFKRSKINHATILTRKFGYSKEQISDFEKQWMELIEQPEWLSFDKPFKGVKEYLIKLKDKHTLYIVTARQSEDAAKRQIEDEGMSYIFREILVTYQKTDKATLIRSVIPQLSPKDWMIGDTGKDIETGKELGIRTAAVLSGFLNKTMLEPYHPDIIADCVTHLKLDAYD